MIVGVYNDRINPVERLSEERVRWYVQEAHRLGLTLLFYRLSDVDLEMKQITGLVWDGEAFVTGCHPIPELTLNEATVSDAAKLDVEKELALRHETHFISNLIGNKFHVQQLLLAQERLRSLVLPSKEVKSLGDFLKLLSSGPVLLKPVNLGKGRGIQVVWKRNATVYALSEGTQETTMTWTMVQKHVQQMVQQKNYMVQPFIQSVTAAGEVFHMRVHIMRRASGDWTSLFTLADVAQPGRHISNYEDSVTWRGEKFLTTEFASHGLTLHNQLLDLSFQIGDALDAAYPFTLDELAIAYGIERTGKVYFFEANTGPEVISFRDEREQKRSRIRMEYVQAVARALESIPFKQRQGKHFKIRRST